DFHVTGVQTCALPILGWRIDADTLERARAVVRRYARPTPLVAAPLLGPGALFKLETEQDTGSFKLRGALAALDALAPDVRAAGSPEERRGGKGRRSRW